MVSVRRTWRIQAIVIGPQTADQQLIGFSCSTSTSCTAAVWAWPQTSPIITQSAGNDWTVPQTSPIITQSARNDWTVQTQP